MTPCCVDCTGLGHVCTRTDCWCHTRSAQALVVRAALGARPVVDDYAAAGAALAALSPEERVAVLDRVREMVADLEKTS